MITSHLLYPTELSSGGVDGIRTRGLSIDNRMLYQLSYHSHLCERHRASLGIRTGRARAHRPGSIPDRCDLSFHRSRIDACRQASILLALAAPNSSSLRERQCFDSFRVRRAKENAPGASLPGRSRYTGGRIEPTSIETMSGRIRAQCFALRHRAGERAQAAISGALRNIRVGEIDPFHDNAWKIFRAQMCEAAHLTPVRHEAQVHFAKS